ncbi:MAG TPA: cell division protein ZapA [Arenimonas sp.]|uniref:cell division protein ZapA n=1 Tax=Arenimonas sp. TaxID=1872635 RepID=UPI002CADA4F9|nr:cell division protein ZapA [Arenimonas sp.]HMB57830.1 cell division protein ZapA [Arenimonas sp.]
MSDPVSVKILDREFTVGVDAEGREGLMAAAHLLDARMREIRGNNKMAALDRVAVLAALNLAHELLQLKNGDQSQSQEISNTLGEMNRKLDGLFDTLAARQ